MRGCLRITGAAPADLPAADLQQNSFRIPLFDGLLIAMLLAGMVIVAWSSRANTLDDARRAASELGGEDTYELLQGRLRTLPRVDTVPINGWRGQTRPASQSPTQSPHDEALIGPVPADPDWDDAVRRG